MADEEIDKNIPEKDKECKEQLKTIAESIISNYNENNKDNHFELLDYMKIALWVYHNIKYDKKYRGEEEFTAMDIFEMKKGVCHHFTRLCNALLYSLGYKVIYVSGYAWVYNNVDIGCFTNHAWSIIKIDDKWYPFDSTWGIVLGKLPVSHIFFTLFWDTFR